MEVLSELWKKSVLHMYTSLVYLVLLNSLYIQAADTKKTSASVCYDLDGKARIRLACSKPDDVIRVMDVYTGVSRLNTCSPARWDCIVDEGHVSMCDGKQRCNMVSELKAQQKGLFCGTGMITYLHVEYTCVTSRSSSRRNNDIVKNGNDIQKFLDTLQSRGASGDDDTGSEAPSLPRLPQQGEAGRNEATNDKEASTGGWFIFEDTFTLICVSVGAVGALIVVISVISAVLHRNKQKRAERRRGDRLSRFLQRSMEMRQIPSTSRGSSASATTSQK